MEPVHFVEQGRHFLYFVDDDLARPGSGGQLLTQQFRPLEIPAILVGLEQVNPDRVRVRLLEQGRLAGLTRPPEEERLAAGGRETQGSYEHELHFIMMI